MPRRRHASCASLNTHRHALQCVMLHAWLTPRLHTQQEVAVGLAVGVGTTGAVGIATGNPLLAGAAGTAAGTAASFQTGIFLRAMDCLAAPGQCSLTSA